MVTITNSQPPAIKTYRPNLPVNMSGFRWNFLSDLLLFLATLPVMFISTLFFWTYKQIVVFFANLIHSKQLVPIGGCDSLMTLDSFPVPDQKLEMSADMKFNLGFVLRVSRKSNVNIKWLREKFEKTFLRRNESGEWIYPRLGTYVIQFGGYSFFKPVESIDLEFQIQEATMPSDQTLNQFLSNFVHAHYKPGTPFWQTILMPAPDAEDELLLIFKIHHVMADGYTLIHMLDMLTDSETPYTVKKFEETWWDMLHLAIQTPRLLYETARDQAGVSPIFATAENDGGFMSFATLNLVDMKRIRKYTGCKFNSICLTLMGGVAQRISLESSTGDKLPAFTYQTLPVSWPNHPAFSNSPPEMCNHWSLVAVKVPLQCSPLERLRVVEREHNRHLEKGLHKIITRFVLSFVGLLPNFAIQIWAANNVASVINSPNMGSSKTYFLNGTPIKAIQLLTGKAFQSTGIAALGFSNVNKFESTLVIKKSIARTQAQSDRISSYLAEELEQLLKQVQDSL